MIKNLTALGLLAAFAFAPWLRSLKTQRRPTPPRPPTPPQAARRR